MDFARKTILVAGSLPVRLSVIDTGPSEGAARGTLIIQSAMPAAVFNYLWAQVHGRDPAAVAGVVVLSTFLGFLLLPLVLIVALGK